LPCNIALLYRCLVQVVVVKKSPISQILNKREVVRVAFVVANVELVEVHYNPNLFAMAFNASSICSGVASGCR